MICQDTPTATSVCRCAEEDAVLYIGSTTTDDVKVMFTRQGDGRVMLVEATRINEEVVIDLPDLATGQVYLVQVVVQEKFPVEYRPYRWDGTDYVPTADLYPGVFLTMEKCYTEGMTGYQSQDQWVTI